MDTNKMRDLKAFAEAALEFSQSGVEAGTFNPYEPSFHSMATPEVILALLSEIEREERPSGLLVQISNQWHDRYQVCLVQLRDAFSERDQLRSELQRLVFAVSDLGGKYDDPGWKALWKARDQARAWLEVIQ